MKGKTHIFIVGFLLVIALILCAISLNTTIQITNKNAMEYLDDKELQTRALVFLFDRNKIDNLPKHFRFSGPDVQVYKFDGISTNTKLFTLIHVVYPVPKLGNLLHSFVFDSEGKCIIHSPDSGFPSTELWDLNGDGDSDVVFHFDDSANCDGFTDIENCALSNKLQIWNIVEGSTEKLFELKYVTILSNNFIVPMLSQNPADLTFNINFNRSNDELSMQPVATIYWSKDTSSYELKIIDKEFCKQIFFNEKD